MSTEVRCPKCHGDKFSILPNGQLKCAYCGNVYSPPSMDKKEQSQGSAQQEEVVHVNLGPQVSKVEEPEKKDKDKKKFNVGIIIGLIVAGFLCIIIFAAHYHSTHSASIEAPLATDSVDTPYSDDATPTDTYEPQETAPSEEETAPDQQESNQGIDEGTDDEVDNNTEDQSGYDDEYGNQPQY